MASSRKTVTVALTLVCLSCLVCLAVWVQQRRKASQIFDAQRQADFDVENDSDRDPPAEPGKNSATSAGQLSVDSDRGRMRRLLITEVQASNGGELRDSDGECPDWIEFWNPNPERFDLTGYFLTDDPDELDQWEFPTVAIEPGARLLVFASGKNSNDPRELHTNFRLSKSGEYLALVHPDGTTIAEDLWVARHSFGAGISLGRTERGMLPLVAPTPGDENAEVAEGMVEEITCSTDSCLFESGVVVTLSCPTPTTEIRYTTDGSMPTASNGIRYTESLQIHETTVIRAIAAGPKLIPSDIVTRSYLSLDGLIHQPATPTGFPEVWGQTKADYEMDPRIAQADEEALRSGLASLPMLSIVADPDRLFGRDGIYANTQKRGFDWEIPASVELLPMDDGRGFAASCGLRLAGNITRLPVFKKHSLRINFRPRYGLSTLEYPLFKTPGKNRFATLMLRGTEDSWASRSRSVRERAQYIRDQWARETEMAMGYLSARSRFVHVCLNGLYWGLYNLVERPDDEFLTHQLGKDPEAYVTLRSRGVKLETDDAGRKKWDLLLALARRDLNDPANYEELQTHLDLVNLIDYCLLRLYIGDEDGGLANDGNNLRAYSLRGRRSPMRFILWDCDCSFASGWQNDVVEYEIPTLKVDGSGSLRDLFATLIKSDRFREQFASRVKLWSNSDSPLGSEVARARYQRLADTVAPGLVAEAARWGDIYADQTYTPAGAWDQQKNRVLSEWFPRRMDFLLANLAQQGLIDLDDVATSTIAD